MAKGVAVKVQNYEETVPKILKLIKFDEELKKHDKIVLKPNLANGKISDSTKAVFVEQTLKFVMENKNPGTEIFIAEGADGHDTMEIFEELGYTNLAEKYDVGLIDLNNTEVEELEGEDFMHFGSISYPKILRDSFVVSLAQLNKNEKTKISASLDNMLGAFPARHYKSFFSKTKNKLRNVPLEYQIHDILKCKMPDLALIDSPDKHLIFVGQPIEMDKQAAKSLGFNWEEVEHLKLMEESPKE